MKETTLYVCEICGERYTSITEAENCEAAHIKPKRLTKTMKFHPYKCGRDPILTGCKGCPFALYLQEELDTLEKFFPNEKKQCELIWAPIYEEYRRIGYRLKPIVNTIQHRAV